ncbi:FHA domain-containing protein [Myxococcota bacterium]|nr:FHA domain-containing protein [Myxococcota bacterium]
MTGEPLSLSVSLDRASIPPGQRTTANLVLNLRAGGTSTTFERSPLSVVFVLDVSASMKGPPLDHLIQSVERLVNLLSPVDQVGIATFSHRADEVLSIRPANPDTKRIVQGVLHRLEAGASTNLEAGLRLGADMMPPKRENERQLMFVLSDGVPSVGLCTPLTLAEVVRKWRTQMSVWTLGYGPHHQEDILNGIASAGGGRYEYIPEPQVCEFAFGRVLGAQGAIVADTVELFVKPSHGVDITRVLGKHELRYSAGGLVFSLPDAPSGSDRTIVAEVALSPGAKAGRWNALQATLNFRAIEVHKLKTLHRELVVNVAEGEPKLAESVHAGVLLVRADEVRLEARALADRGHFEGAAAVITNMVKAIEAFPGFTPFDGSPLSEAREELVDELQVMESKPKTEVYKAFRRSQLSISVSFNDSSITDQDNAYGQEVIRAVAGDYPNALLEQLSGLEAGRKLPLKVEQLIGRAKGADIVLGDARVTRHHAKIFAQRGQFWILDLGSGSGTWLNGGRVETHVLTSGDILTIGDTKLRYEEVKELAEPRLIASTPDGGVFVVEKDRLFVIGSSRACTMCIDSPKIGRQHAAVRYKNQHFWLEDYGSVFGTQRANGERITERVKIRDGDEFVMGDVAVKFTFRM